MAYQRIERSIERANESTYRAHPGRMDNPALCSELTTYLVHSFHSLHTSESIVPAPAWFRFFQPATVFDDRLVKIVVDN